MNTLTRTGLRLGDSLRSPERLNLILGLTNRVVSKLDLPDLLQETSVSIRQVMQSDAVGVALPDPETGELRYCALDCLGRPETAHLLSVGESAMQVFRTGQLINLTKETIGEYSTFTETGYNSLCILPLVRGERVHGVLILASSLDNAFTHEDICFIAQVANQITLAVENALAHRELSQLKNRLARENVYQESESPSELHLGDIVGKSKVLQHVLKEIETVATTDSTVLIYGETGTGKELIARAVHNLSNRRSNSFVNLNCAAIPTGLLESELFGHEKGAFTGAITQRVGRFELANRGTIFLDEVGELPLELQPKLLRVLQEREFERLGGTRTFRTDARLIAATNRDPETMVREQKFRSDLYYRLNVFPIRVPALRERPEDIPLLVRHFVQEFNRRNNRAIDTIPSETMEALLRYHWPGNIRELQNVIERAVIISKGTMLNVSLAGLQADVTAKPSHAATKVTPAEHKSLQDILDETQRTEILRVLEASNGILAGPTGAAARLGMKRSTLQLRMQKLGIRLARMALADAEERQDKRPPE